MFKANRHIPLLVVVVLYATTAWAQSGADTAEKNGGEGDLKNEQSVEGGSGGKAPKDIYDLQKFEFGVGIGLESYRASYVGEAKTFGSGRVVRVTDSQRVVTSVWLETHYTWDGWAASSRRERKSDGSSEKGTSQLAGPRFTHSAPGFYIAARLVGKDSNIFDGFGLGLLWAFKRTALTDTSDSDRSRKSINVGIGPVWHRTKELADSIKVGSELPTEFTDIEYKKRDEISWMILVSTGF